MFHQRNCHLVAGVVVLFLSAVMADLAWKDCGSRAIVHSVSVSPCLSIPDVPTEDEGCQLHRGTSHMVNITFETAFPVTAVRHDILGEVLGMLLRLPGLPRDRAACQHLIGGCPIPANTLKSYTFFIAIKPFYPMMKTKIRYLIQERSAPRRTLVCFEIPALITS